LLQIYGLAIVVNVRVIGMGPFSKEVNATVVLLVLAGLAARDGEALHQHPTMQQPGSGAVTTAMRAAG
jgi:hypothetical protein